MLAAYKPRLITNAVYQNQLLSPPNFGGFFYGIFSMQHLLQNFLYEKNIFIYYCRAVGSPINGTDQQKKIATIAATASNDSKSTKTAATSCSSFYRGCTIYTTSNCAGCATATTGTTTSTTAAQGS